MVTPTGRLCACGCGTPLRGRTQLQYAGRSHVLRVHGGDGRNNGAARQAMARTLALKRFRRWAVPVVESLIAALDRDTLTREQIARCMVAAERIAKVNYAAGYKAGAGTVAKRAREGRALNVRRVA